VIFGWDTGFLKKKGIINLRISKTIVPLKKTTGLPNLDNHGVLFLLPKKIFHYHYFKSKKNV
jgi:hypothetical protein